MSQSQIFRSCAITDEFHWDLQTALTAMAQVGMTGVELRMVYGKNILELTNDELAKAMAVIRAMRMQVVSIASPIGKCELPGTGPLDSRFPVDQFGSKFGFSDQDRLFDRALKVMEITGADVLRAFAFLRGNLPADCMDRVAEMLSGWSEEAAQHHFTLGIENEQCTNVATGYEAAFCLSKVKFSRLVWDPANALISGETPFPDGYCRLLPQDVIHVHAKNARPANGKFDWCPLDAGQVDWPGQLSALEEDEYPGWVSLETHWPIVSPKGENEAFMKLQASVRCGRVLQGMLTRRSAAVA